MEHAERQTESLTPAERLEISTVRMEALSGFLIMRMPGLFLRNITAKNGEKFELVVRTENTAIKVRSLPIEKFKLLLASTCESSL